MPVICNCRGSGGELQPPGARPRWAKLVERWFRRPGDVGVGDSFEHMAEAFGADRVAKFVKRWGIDCGCGDRKAKWNRLYPYG